MILEIVIRLVQVHLSFSLAFLSSYFFNYYFFFKYLYAVTYFANGEAFSFLHVVYLARSWASLCIQLPLRRWMRGVKQGVALNP